MALIELFAFVLCEYIKAIAITFINIVSKNQSLDANLASDSNWRPNANWRPAPLKPPYLWGSSSNFQSLGPSPNLQSWGSSSNFQSSNFQPPNFPAVSTSTHAQITNSASWYTITDSKAITLLPSGVEFDKAIELCNRIGGTLLTFGRSDFHRIINELSTLYGVVGNSNVGTMDFWIGATSHGGGIIRWLDGNYFDTRGFNVTGWPMGGGGTYPIGGVGGGGPYPIGGGWDAEQRGRWPYDNFGGGSGYWPPGGPGGSYSRSCASLSIYQVKFSYLLSSQIILGDCLMIKRAICQKRNVLEPIGFVAIAALIVAAICLLCIFGWICRKKLCCACCSSSGAKKSYGSSWTSGWGKKNGRSFNVNERSGRSLNEGRRSPVIIDRIRSDRIENDRIRSDRIPNERIPNERGTIERIPNERGTIERIPNDRITTGLLTSVGTADRLPDRVTTSFKTPISDFRSSRITSDTFAA